MTFSSELSFLQKICSRSLYAVIQKIPENWSITTNDIFTLLDLCEIEPKIQDSLTPLLFLALLAERQQGSTCLSLHDRHWAASLSQDSRKEIENQLFSWITCVEEGLYSAVVTNNANDFKPLLLVKREGKYFLYLHRSLSAERSISEGIQQLISVLNEDVLSPKNDVEKKVALFRESVSFEQYNVQQKLAIVAALQKNFLVITGGPGTGKTFTLSGILQNLLLTDIRPEQIILAAPTARASMRMHESIRAFLNQKEIVLDQEHDLLQIECVTMHRLLGISTFSPEGSYAKNFRLPYRVVVIDEASMVDLHLMNILLQSIDLMNTKLIMMGDREQLPSVAEGAILGDLIQRIPSQYIIRLEESYRASEGLGRWVSYIRHKNREELDKIPEFKTIDAFVQDPNVSLGLLALTSNSKQSFLEAVRFSAQRYFVPSVKKFQDQSVNGKFLLEYTKEMNQFKILSLLNYGYFGVNNVNRICRDTILQELQMPLYGEYCAGMPIQILENNNYLKLYNGDIGIVLENKGHATQIGFTRGDGLEIFSTQQLPSLQLGFATTVHKSQGSEYEIVLLVVPPESPASLLFRALLYTAVSRAKQKCLIISSRESLQQGFLYEHKRETGLLLA